MIGPRSGLLVLGAGALAVYGSQGLWSKADVAFTRAAPPAPASVDLRPAASTIHVALPVDFQRVARRAEAALDQRLALGLSGDANDPACAKRQPVGDCAPLKLDGTVRQAGPVDVAMRGPAIRVSIPLKIEPVVAAGAPARPLVSTSVQPSLQVEREPAECVPVAVTLGFTFSARHNPGAGFTIARIDEGALDVASASASPGARIARQLEGRLRQVALAAQDELQQTLAALPIATATQRAWTALSQSIPIGLGSGALLSATPEVAGTGELATIAGKTTFRIPITARLAIGPAETTANGQLASSLQKPLVNGEVLSGKSALIRMAVPLRLEGLQQAADAEFLRAGAMETQPDRFGPSVKVTVQRTRVYPSARQIAIELDVTATRFEGQTFHGKAHLVGRPVLDAAQTVVTLADITFPPVPPREAGGPKAPANAPRLATEPFASKLASVARIDVSREASDAVPRAMNLLHQRIGERLTLSARIDAAKPVSVETSRDGAWLVTDVSGDLILTYDGPQELVVGASVSEPAPKNGVAGRAAIPELAAAAVVSAAATSVALSTKTAMGAPVGTVPGAQREQTNTPPARNRPAVKPADPAAPKKAAVPTKPRPTNLAKRDWVPFASN